MGAAVSIVIHFADHADTNKFGNSNSTTRGSVDDGESYTFRDCKQKENFIMDIISHQSHCNGTGRKYSSLYHTKEEIDTALRKIKVFIDFYKLTVLE